MNTSPPNHKPSNEGLAGTITRWFIDSPLTPLVIISSILLGLAALILLPREEEPQIKVPMIDVLVSMPGFSAREVENRATKPMEELIWEIEGVEYVYSISKPGQSLVIVRFKVGEDIEKSLVKLNQKLQSNYDRIPRGVSFPLIKPKSIDDVPILALTFHSASRDHLALGSLVAEVENILKATPDVAETKVIGGQSRTIRVQLDLAKLTARSMSPIDIYNLLQQTNQENQIGTLTEFNTEIALETVGFLKNADDVKDLVIGVYEGRPVYLRDVAQILDGADDVKQIVLHGTGRESDSKPAMMEPAVTLTLAKKPGSNAVKVAASVLQRLENLKGYIIPEDVSVSISRHYGETASEKSNELLFHMGIAIVSVSLLILFALGWRESLIVAIAIPSTLALTLLVFYLYGFTLNRITLFALIFSIGILVDDAIVVVENIVRHVRMPKNQGRDWSQIAHEAVSEVGNPTILATFAVIAAVLPMAFVGGLMGPYMRPIPIGAGAAMFFSLAIAFIVTPWAGVRVLKWRRTKNSSSHDPAKEDFLTRSYRVFMNPLIHDAKWRWTFLLGIMALLALACLLLVPGWVQVKMLPFDNKSEFQVILNMPEGTPLETTTQAGLAMSRIIAEQPEVDHFQLYAGTAAPFNFNGLVRHYDLRTGPFVADIQVNLKSKHERKDQSHAIASRFRELLTPIAKEYNMDFIVSEVPPGPPVLQTLVAEIYGPNESSRALLAGKINEIFRTTEGVVDVEWLREEPQRKIQFLIDKEKCALLGIEPSTVSMALQMMAQGLPVDLLHDPSEIKDVNIVLELPQEDRSTVQSLLGLQLPSQLSTPDGTGSGQFNTKMVSLRECVEIKETILEQTIYHKNLLPVQYVTGDVAGIIESPFYAILEMNKSIRALDSREFGGYGEPVKILNASMPEDTRSPAVKWDGEWDITLEVFRDLGLAFLAVLILIYILMVGWFQSYITPLVVMAAIPFSLIGILPAHALMGAFFTATSMIGFMAGAGIVVRNSIILVDFIEQRIEEGIPMSEAVVEAGAVRFRPMLLTALAVVVGASVILFDPIFQGLALSLMAGELASLFVSRMAVPVLYTMAHQRSRLNQQVEFAEAPSSCYP